MLSFELFDKKLPFYPGTFEELKYATSEFRSLITRDMFRKKKQFEKTPQNASAKASDLGILTFLAPTFIVFLLVSCQIVGIGSREKNYAGRSLSASLVDPLCRFRAEACYESTRKVGIYRYTSLDPDAAEQQQY
jgi:hypothetical protein